MPTIRPVLTILLFLVLHPFSLFAQKEGNIWYFGIYAGIDFNTSPPTVLSDGRINTREGVTSLCDANGRLLLYSDGTVIYDARHQVMPNGYNLRGNYSASQSVIAVPWPGHPGKYYLFTTAVSEGVNYSIIDMTLNNGYGDVEAANKNVAMMSTALSTEKLMVTKHCNNTDFWVITPARNSNDFYVFLLSAAGLSAPAIYSVGTPISNDIVAWETVGYIKVSPNGKLLTHVRGDSPNGPGSSFAEIFPFNNQTGAIGNPIAQLGNLAMGYGIEYSPDSKLLYLSTTASPSYLIQYDLTAADINASAITLSSSGTAFGALQLAPDGKIYLAMESSYNVGYPTLHAITNPNVRGPGAQLTSMGINLYPGQSLLGLPTVMNDYVYAPYTIKATDTCVGKATTFTLKSTENITGITWDFGDGATATGLTVTHQYAAPGAYTVRANYTGPCVTGATQLTFQVNGPITTRREIMICNGGAYTLPDGSTTAAAGTYTTTLKRNDGCNNDSTIITTITLNGSYHITIDAAICPGGSYQLPDNQVVNTSGDYTTKLTSLFGCDSIITTRLTVLPAYHITETRSICNNEIVTLPDGRMVRQPGVYTSLLKTRYTGCDSTVVTNVVAQTNNYFIDVKDTCINSNASFSLGGGAAATAIHWDFGDGQQSTGLTASHHYLQPGSYTVTAVATGICNTPVTFTRVVTLRETNTSPHIIHICNGNSYTLPDGTITGSAGTYRTTLQNTYGCDSVITTTIVVNQPYHITVDTSICRGSAIVLPDGRLVSASGNYTSTFTSLYACDSIITTRISYLPDYSLSKTVNICKGNSYTLPDGRTVSQSGVYTAYLKTVFYQCDSIIATTVNVIDAHASVEADICEKESYVLPDQRSVRTAGVYTSVLRSYQGCDSVITTTLRIHPAYSFHKEATFCETDYYTLEDGRRVNTPGNYVVKFRTVKGCDSIYSTTLRRVSPPKISLGSDSCLIAGRTLVLTPGPGFLTYVWQDGSTTPYMTVTREGMYAVRVTNSCGSDATQMRVIACSAELFVPSAFTPNGDGKNDVFRIINYHGQQLLRFSIYNRWGQEIFTTNNPLMGWDGCINGTMQDIGAYVYLIRYKNLQGQERVLKGTVTLVK